MIHKVYINRHNWADPADRMNWPMHVDTYTALHSVQRYGCTIGVIARRRATQHWIVSLVCGGGWANDTGTYIGAQNAALELCGEGYQTAATALREALRHGR
jgi:hypothetical protein